MKKTIFILATVLFTSLSSSITAAGDPEAGQTKSATCAVQPRPEACGTQTVRATRLVSGTCGTMRHT